MALPAKDRHVADDAWTIACRSSSTAAHRFNFGQIDEKEATVRYIAIQKLYGENCDVNEHPQAKRLGRNSHSVTLLNWQYAMTQLLNTLR